MEIYLYGFKFNSLSSKKTYCNYLVSKKLIFKKMKKIFKILSVLTVTIAFTISIFFLSNRETKADYPPQRYCWFWSDYPQYCWCDLKIGYVCYGSLCVELTVRCEDITP